MFPPSQTFQFALFAALLLASTPFSAVSQDLGSVSGASRFFFLDEEFLFKGPVEGNCGSEIPDASGGEPPAFPLDFSESLTSGVINYLPALQLLDASTETTLSIQNTGETPGVPVILLFGENSRDDVIAECGGVLAPGSSFTLQPSSIPKDFEFGIVVSFPADFISSGSDILDLCDFYKQIAMGNLTPSKGGGGGAFESAGPNLAVQVQRLPAGQGPDSPRVSTQYTGITERMFDIFRFDGSPDTDAYRYEIGRVLTTDDAETQIHMTPFSLAVGLGFGLKGTPEINFHSTFRDEITGATTPGPSGILLSGDHLGFKISDFVGDSFAGAWIVDSSQPLAIVADYAYPNSRYSSVLGVRAYEISGFQPNSRSAWAPLLQEEGWETEVTLNNQDGNEFNTIILKLRDSLGNELDQREVIVDPLETLTVTYSPSLLNPESRAGVLFAHGDQSFVGQVRQVRRGSGGEVLDVLSYNLIEEDVSVDADTFFEFNNKGFSPDEEGGSEVLALPLMVKSDPNHGGTTEILLTNLNPIPGLTSATLYVYDNAGLRDTQCVLLRPLETLLIPIDFPSLGEGALASVVIRGASTSQKVRRNNGDIFNTMAFAAIAIQRSTSPPDLERDSNVALAPGGNDAGMSETGIFYPIATAGVGETLFFPALNRGGTVDQASDSITIQPIDFGTTCRAGVVFFASEELVGVEVSETISFKETFLLKDSDIPPEADSAVAFSLDPADATAIVRFMSLGRVGQYAAFLRDYREQTGILPSFSVSGILHRDSPAAESPAKRVLTSYEAPSRRQLGLEDDVFGGWNAVLPLILTGEGFDTVVSIQNAGTLATGIELIFIREENPKSEPTIKNLKDLKSSQKGSFASSGASSGQTFRIDLLQPGVSRTIRPAELVGIGFRGKLLIRSTQSVVATVDLQSGGTLSTYIGAPDELIDGDFGSNPTFTRGSDVAYGPLAYSPSEGWETVVQVLNLNRLIDAKVRVDFYSSGGNNVHTQTGFVPPGGVAAFRRPPIQFDLTDSPTNSDWVQITSEDYWREGSSPIPAPNVLGVIQLNKKNADGCLLESMAYNTYAERGVFNFPGNAFPFPLELGFSSVFKGFSDLETSTEIALVNLNPNSGTTTLTNVAFDGDGFTTALSDLTLNPRESRLLRTLDLPGIPSGVEGSLSLLASLGNSFQEGGPGIVGVVVHRAYGLLPNEECASEQATETFTPTPTTSATQTGTMEDTATFTQTLTPSETPTGTLPTATETPTQTPTMDEDDLLRADVNRDRRVDTQDILIILEHYLETY